MDISTLPLTPININFLKSLKVGNSDYVILKDIDKNVYDAYNPKYPNKEYIFKKILLLDEDIEGLNITIDSFRSVQQFIVTKCYYQHRFICYSDLFLSDDKKYVCYTYEKVKGKDLWSGWPEDPLLVDFSLLVLIAYRLFSSLEILHKHKIYHRDIKPDNIIFNKNGHVYDFLKLIDFDFSCNEANCKGTPGTSEFAAFDIIVNYASIDWEEADIKSALITIIKLYTTYNYDTDVYIQINEEFYVDRNAIYSNTLKVGILRKHKGIRTYAIENEFMKFLIDVLQGDKNLNAKYIMKNIEKIMRGCLPKEILYN